MFYACNNELFMVEKKKESSLNLYLFWQGKKKKENHHQTVKWTTPQKRRSRLIISVYYFHSVKNLPQTEIHIDAEKFQGNLVHILLMYFFFNISKEVHDKYSFCDLNNLYVYLLEFILK